MSMKFFKQALITIYTICKICAPALSQSAGYVTYTGADGFSGSGINFLQSSDGNLWVGSYSNGVSRFNGHAWENWDINHGLEKNNIINLDKSLIFITNIISKEMLMDQ